MNKLLGLAPLLILTANASAESHEAGRPASPSDGYAGAHVSLGTQRAEKTGMHLDAGARLAESAWSAHGMATIGMSGSDGWYHQLRLGIESRGCALRETFCVFAGFDAGYQRDQVHDRGWSWGGSEPAPEYFVDAHDLLLVPRAGVEVGRSIKLRAAVEVPTSLRVDGTMDSDTRGAVGVAVMFGVSYAP